MKLMASNIIPSRKYSTINMRFNPYGRPSLRSHRKTMNPYDMQEMEWGIKASIDSYERELRQREDEDVQMGSDMDLNLSINARSGTYGCVDSVMSNYEEIEPLAVIPMIAFEAWRYQYQSPKKRKLVRGLHKGINKHIDHHCKKKHAGTDQLRERMYIALQAALLDVDVDEIILPDASSDQAHARKNSIRQILGIHLEFKKSTSSHLRLRNESSTGSIILFHMEQNAFYSPLELRLLQNHQFQVSSIRQKVYPAAMPGHFVD
ncbi:hypothetical protein C8R48DRAFT_676825 [Suillus tomentosus]|nr:hypothetical protein C8R48DRAFT_676825 [Suillus tomentosus]